MAKKKYEDYLKELQEKSKKLEYKPQVYTHSLEKKAVLPIKKVKDVNTINDIYNFANNNQKSYSQQVQDYKESLKQTQKDANKLRSTANKFDLDLNGVRFEAPTKNSIMNRDISAPIYNRHNKNTIVQNPVERTKQANKELNRQILAYKGNIENSKELKDYNERKDKINAVLEYSMNVAKNRENTTNEGKYTSSFIGNMGNALIPFRNQFKTEKGDAVVLPNYNQIRASQFKEKSDSGLYKAYSDLTGSLGNMVPGIMAGAVSGGLGSAVFGANTFSTARNQALLEGYDGSSASTYGIVNAGLELGIGKLLGGASAIMGKSPVAKEIGSKFTSKFMSNPTIASLTADMISEFGEEYVQEWLDPKVRAYLLEHKDIVESWKSSDFLSKENFYAGLLGSLSAGVMNTPNAIRNQSNLNDQIDSIVTNIENNTETKLSKEEKQSIRKSFYDEYNKAIKTNTEVNYDNITQNTGLPVTNKPILPGLNTNNQYSMQDMTMNNSNTYQYIKSDNSKIDNLRRSASEQKFNNSEQTTNFINMLEKIISDKDIDIVFDSTLSNNVNGKYENGIITINPNSSRVGEFIAVHELTHAIGTDSMRKIVDNYRKSNLQFESALQSILKNYNTTELTDEAMADVAGQLFGNQEFINNLSQTNPSLFKRIYNEIKYLWHQFTGYKNQNQFIEDLQYKWEQAYRSSNEFNGISNYSYETLKDGTSYVKLEDNLFTNNDGTPMTQKNIYNSLIGKTITFNDGITATIKAWLPDNKNMYNELFKRYPKYNNVSDIKTINKRINENMVELLEKSNGKSYNEPDYNNRHSQNKISTFDTRTISLFDGKSAYNLDLSIAKMNDGTYVAYAKRNLSENTQLSNKIKKEAPMSKSQGVLPYANKVPQNKQNVNDTTKYSIQETQNNTQDNQGRELTKEQQEYFKDSKVRDENGDLLEVYHGTNVDFNVFNYDNFGVNGNCYGTGFYFTDDIKEAEHFTNNETIKKVYLNIKKPLNAYGKKMSYSKFSKIFNSLNEYGKNNIDNYNDEEIFGTNENAKKFGHQDNISKSTYDFYNNSNSNAELMEAMFIYSNKMGLDIPTSLNIFEKATGNDGMVGEMDNGKKIYVTFNSNQIKNVDNTNPTTNEDIRYSKNNATWQEYLEDNFEASGTRTNMKDIKLPIKKSKVPLPKQLSNENIEISKQKTMNPSEISKLTKEDASSTPKLPTKKNVNKVGDGNSKYFDNILFKTDMLDSNSKKLILSDEDVKYYDKVTNKESLEKAYNKINNGGSAEVLNWNNKFQLDSEGKTKSTATATDIAEGWILMKQYQDAGDYDSMVQIAKTMRQIGTQAGQTIQAFNILERMTPEGMVKYAQSELSEAYDRMVKHKSKEWIDKHQKDFDLNPQEVAFIMDTMNEVSKMKDGYDKRVKLAEIQKLITDKIPPKSGEGIKSWMRISMLFNPKTQVRNVLGNAVIAPVNYFSDLVSTVADKAISKKTGVRTTASTNLKQYTKGFKKGLFESYNDFKKGINTRDMQGNRFEIGQGKSFNNKTAIGKGLNRVDSLLSFMLDAGDRGFYEASFTNSINNQMVINKTNEVTQEMIDIATQEALSRTWQDNNNYTKFVLGIRKFLNSLNVKGYGLGDVLIPFAKTPANLTKAIVDYSPLGLVSTINDGVRLNKSLNNGQYNAQMQHKFVQNLGKALAGSMLYIVGYALAKSGVISGESDDDKDIANFMKNTLGISNYSIKIGNKSFTYDWAQPIATPLTVMANYQKNKEEGASLQENITSVLDTGLNVLFEQSFLESLSDFLSNPGEMGTKLQEQVLELPSRAIPTFMKQIADMVDGTTRTTFEKNKPLATAVNKVKAKLPVVSKTLAPSTDTMGREIQKYGGKNNIFNVFLNPANINTENISESAEEIYKIYKATGEKSVMPRVPEYSYKDKDGNEIKFTASDRSKFTNESGKIIDKEIANLMKTPEYKSMSNIEKAETIKSIVDYSYNIAKNKVTGIELSDSYKKAYSYSKIGDVSDYYLFKKNIDDTTKDTKKTSIVNYLLDSELEDKQIAYLYDIYYSSPETLNNIINASIPMKEYIKFNSADIEGEFDESKGRTKTNSKKNETIKYVNSLKLSIPQKAFLIRTKYSSYDNHNNKIINYINEQNIEMLDKYKLIKEAQIDSYDKEIVEYVNSQSMTSTEKQELLKEMGFTIKNGRVYY